MSLVGNDSGVPLVGPGSPPGGGDHLVGRAGLLETFVRGSWYRVNVALEDDCLSITLDEQCENTTTLNGNSINNNVETPGALSVTPDVPDSIANQTRLVR
nr:unnamed protein product [Callosobruchus analis]